MAWALVFLADAAASVKTRSSSRVRLVTWTAVVVVRELRSVEIAIWIASARLLFAILVVSWIPSIVSLIRERRLFPVVCWLAGKLATLVLRVIAVVAERDAAAVSASTSALDDEGSLLAWRRHEIGIAVVLAHGTTVMGRRTLAAIILLAWPVAQRLRVVAGIDARLLIDVDHATSRSILSIVLLSSSTEFTRFHHQDLLKLILQLCFAAIAHIWCDE